MDSSQNKAKPSIFHAVGYSEIRAGFWEKMDGSDRSWVWGTINAGR
jgi:hypothetical protein